MMKWLLLLALVAGCTAPPARAPAAPTAAVAGVDAAWYLQAESAGKNILRIDPQQSLIAVTVRRGGRLARLGHDHVVASRNLFGFVAADDGQADFQFRLDELTVDEPGLRRDAGLEPDLPAEAINGTRQNMLTRVLEAQRFPLVVLRAVQLAATDSTMQLTITLHGVTRTIMVPVQVGHGERWLAASGRFDILQSEFGITPMAVLGGAIAVEDRLQLRFHIVAQAAAAR